MTDEEAWRQRTSQTLGSGGGGNVWVLGWATYSQELQCFIGFGEYTAEPTMARFPRFVKKLLTLRTS